jgi:chlorite dismutase
MVTREPPQTEEGWYALHDLRTIDWDAWRDAPGRVRERALDDGESFLDEATAVTDAETGQSAVFTVLGHKADLMVVHLRPTMADLDTLERRFEATEFARFTEQTTSYVSVTEASGYTERAREYFDGEVDDDSGLAQYIQSRLHPEIPDSEHVCFYPMEKRRDPDYNWYDLPFEERAEHMASHGDIGRGYAGKVQQMITGSVGMDDWEWGVTLWADDMTDIKDLLYEMRFDPSSSKYAEFGPFYVGRRIAPADLEPLLAGERVPVDGEAVESGASSEWGDGDTSEHASSESSGDSGTGERADSAGGDAGTEGDDGAEGDDEADDESAGDDGEASGSGGRPPMAGDGDEAEVVGDIAQRLATFGVYPDDYGDAYGLVFYADGDAEDIVDDVEGLRENFDHYDTHVLTSVRADQGQAAIVSVWDNERAATTAAGFLSDVDGVTEGVRGPLSGEGGDGAGGDSGTDGDGATSRDGVDADGDDGTEATAHGDGDETAVSIREELAEQGIYAGQPHGEDVYALVLYSTADPEALRDEVVDLREGFGRYDTHVKTAVYQDVDGDTTAVASLWETEDAADTAAGYLSELPDIVGRPQDREGFGTMGMFYTVEPDYREEFVDTFDDVGDVLAGMDGHRETALLANVADGDDMFITSRWDSREDAMAFFRSEDFRDTVAWGREVLADTPRHVFLA